MTSFSFVEFMKEGGWSMWPILLLGLATAASAGAYAARPRRTGVAFVAALWVTLLVATAHGVVSDVAAVLLYLEDPLRVPEAQLARVLLVGLKESSRPAVLGGIFLTLAPLLLAMGLYRNGQSPFANASSGAVD